MRKILPLVLLGTCYAFLANSQADQVAYAITDINKEGANWSFLRKIDLKTIKEKKERRHKGLDGNFNIEPKMEGTNIHFSNSFFLLKEPFLTEKSQISKRCL